MADHTLRRRYEIKYLVSETRAAAITQFIRPYVRPDRYCKVRPKGAYPIVSLYLDSQDMRLCRESLTGKKNRFKLRIRSYTDDLDYPRFFEIKRRMNTVIVKDRSMVAHHEIPGLLSGIRPPAKSKDRNAETLAQFQLYTNSLIAGPVLLVRYQRQAFEGIADSRLRVTFDRDLCCKTTSAAEVGLDGQGWQRYRMDGVILEIKFTDRYPVWLGRMVRYFDLRQQSLSKYARSVKKACLSGFCAPEIPVRTYQL